MDDNVFSEEQNTAAHRILTSAKRELAREYPYLERGIFYHKMKASSKTDFMGADYVTLYYNPAGVIAQFQKKRRNIKHTLLHIVLHCMCHHPSMEFSDAELFDAAADVSVNAMLESLFKKNSCFRKFASNCGGISAPHIYKTVKENRKLKNRLKALHESSHIDDHRMWRQEYAKDFSDSADLAGKAGSEQSDGISALMIPPKGQENANAYDDWAQIHITAEQQSSKGLGSDSGDLFADIAPPDRYSKADHIAYIKKFIQDEIIREDPDTIDLMMYTASLDIYGDMPIVEFCETQENLNPSDMIIAMDMSGSCSGDIAVNFLRQVYTLFEGFNIQGRVNIHVVTFDTKIQDHAVIQSRGDADSFIRNYKGHGFGGTDFRCVFDFAEKYSKETAGKKLKGLFFFSDGDGTFPSEKPDYPTVFFIPGDPDQSYWSGFDPKPQWVDFVRYSDN